MTIRNIGILAHVDAGKTTLTEQLLYLGGVIRSPGRVDDGTTTTDSLSVERQRGISVRSATASFTVGDSTVNLIDTPGHVDFAGEVERCLCALDFAVVVISAPDGVRAHTENILRALDAYRMPRLVFINKIDRAGADAEGILRDLSRLGQHPILLSETDGIGSRDCAVRALPVTAELLADHDDDIAERYLAEEEIPQALLESVFCTRIAEASLTPVLCGSAMLGIGVPELLRFLITHMPDSAVRSSGELSGVIFKIEHDSVMGKTAYVRLFGGALKNRDSVPLTSPDGRTAEDKISQIRRFNGAKCTDTGAVGAGDIAALCGLSHARTGMYVGTPASRTDAALAHPFLRVQAVPTDPAQLTELAGALRELSEEEPYLDAKWENGQSEIVVNLTGSVQLEILTSLLRERYNLTADFSPPSVIYKETPARAVDGFASYTMPKPCWAVVRLGLEPLPRGSGIVYNGGRVPSNKLFYRYQEHIRQSFFDSLSQGIAGWEITDMKATLLDGEHHTIHTHPLDFFVCTPMALMNGLASAGTTILEPLLKLRITAPMEYTGRILTDITQMKGEYDTPITVGDSVTIEGIVPVAESLDYTVRLASATSGKAVCTPVFAGYRPLTDGSRPTTPRRGPSPLDRSKWILYARGAMQDKL